MANLWQLVLHTPLARTRQSIIDDSCASPKQHSVKHHPLVQLPLGLNTPLYKAVLIDILHMRIRLACLLIRNSIWDCEARTGDPLAKPFEALLRSIGIRFTMYPSKKPGACKVAWTQLTRSEVRKLLSVAGPAILASEGVFEHKEELGMMWQKTDHFLSFVNSCEKADAPEVGRLGMEWGQYF